jgi:hypothetical protein
MSRIACAPASNTLRAWVFDALVTLPSLNEHASDETRRPHGPEPGCVIGVIPASNSEGEPVTGSLFPESRMAPSPIAHHRTINLAGIAERLRFRFDDFVPHLARATVRVFRLVRAYTPTAVMRLAFLHDALPNPVVR